MNKKLKLILSCFCLCLTLGIMSVAVWAATTTNYTLSNTISYQIEDVYVRVQTKLYKKSTAGMVSGEDLISQCEALEGKKHSEITGVTLVETYDEFKTYDGKSAINPSTTGCNCDIAYDTSAQNPAFAYYVVMEIENYASDPIHAYLVNKIPTSFTGNPSPMDINSHFYFTTNFVEISGNSITSVVIGFALKDSTIALSETNAPFDLRVCAGEYNPEDFMNFIEKKDETGTVTGYSVRSKNSNIAGPIIIPETYNNVIVNDVPSGAFSGCRFITKIIIPDSVTNIGAGAFASCYNLLDVSIGNNISIIASSSFAGCCSLKDIIIPNSVLTIETGAFAACDLLKSITIGNKVSSIGDGVFASCRSLENIIVESGNNVFHVDGNCVIETQSKKLVIGCVASIIPDDGSVTSIGKSAFTTCHGMIKFEIPEKVTSISANAFGGCKDLTSLTIHGATSTNWGYASSDDATEWTPIDLTNSGTNANYFKSQYQSKCWKKIG